MSTLTTSAQPVPVKPENASVRRTPYHQKDEYVKGDTAAKAKIIRSVLRMGHKVTTSADNRELAVNGAHSIKGELRLTIFGRPFSEGYYTAPIFHHPGKK